MTTSRIGRRPRASLACLLTLSLLAGCHTLPSAEPREPHRVIGSIVIERGRPVPVLDGIGWVVGLPTKLLLWDRRGDNHAVSLETEMALVNYMQQNSLDDVLVRVNQYDPLGEWGRLTRNDRVGAGWRYSLGTLHMIEYTLLPGRVLGGDWYNPYTDTINLYSDVPPLALAKAAYAKDVHQRIHPGTYAAVQQVPLVGMWHETLANRDVLDFVKSQGTDVEQDEANRILYPDYGSAWGGQVASFVPFGHMVGRLAGAAVGHAAAAFKGGKTPRSEDGEVDFENVVEEDIVELDVVEVDAVEVDAVEVDAVEVDLADRSYAPGFNVQKE